MTRTKLPDHEQASIRQAQFLVALAKRVLGDEYAIHDRLGVPYSGRLERYVSRTEASDLIEELLQQERDNA